MSVPRQEPPRSPRERSSEGRSNGEAPSDDALARAAADALERAYSPYSGFRVGAALLAADGRVFAGCNVENASYGLTICAERTALVKAVSEGARQLETIAIATERDEPWTPCGACRQALYEFAPSLRILLVGRSGQRVETSLGDLLPDAFGPSDL